MKTMAVQLPTDVTSASAALPADLDLTLLSTRPARLSDATLSVVDAPFPFIALPPMNALQTLVSIVIVTHNQLPFTKLCVRSLLTNTGWGNYELIVVDNASSDGTPDFLRQLAER